MFELFVFMKFGMVGHRTAKAFYFLFSPLSCAGLAMADREAHEEQSRRSSSLERKRPSGDDVKSDNKRRRVVTANQAGSTRGSPAGGDDVDCAGSVSAIPVPGPSSEKLDTLTSLLSGLIDKLDKGPGSSTKNASPVYGGFHDMSSSDEDCVVAENGNYCSDPLDRLDTFDSVDPAVQPADDDASFLRVLDDFSECFHGDEPKGDPISDRLASILSVSLRRRPNSDTVKSTCTRLKVPSNVPNMTVPETNSAITKAMNVGGKLLDTRLAHTNSLLLRALVPLTYCISDIGDKSGKPLSTYLDGLMIVLDLLSQLLITLTS